MAAAPEDESDEDEEEGKLFSDALLQNHHYLQELKSRIYLGIPTPAKGSERIEQILMWPPGVV